MHCNDGLWSSCWIVQKVKDKLFKDAVKYLEAGVAA